MIQVLEPEVRQGSELSNTNCQLANATYYKNLTGETVTLIHRSGYNETIPPAAASHRGVLQITVVRSGHRDVCFNALANESGHEHILDRLYSEQMEKGSFSGKLEYTYWINRKQITSEGAYIPDLDIVVVKGIPRHPITHPYSNKAAIANGAFVRDGVGVTARVYSIDHERRNGGQAYVNVFGAVGRVVNQHNDMLGSGIYVALSDCSGETRVIHHTKESSLIRVFDTYDEAENSTAREIVEDSIKRQLAEYKLREVESQGELAKLKAKLDEESRRFDYELKTSTARLAGELEAVELRNKELTLELSRVESMRDAARKEMYEESSNNRKTAAEYLKIAPTVLSVASAALKFS